MFLYWRLWRLDYDDNDDGDSEDDTNIMPQLEFNEQMDSILVISWWTNIVISNQWYAPNTDNIIKYIFLQENI